MYPQALQDDLWYPVVLVDYPRVVNIFIKSCYYTCSCTLSLCSDLMCGEIEACSLFTTPLFSSRASKSGHITAKLTSSTISTFAARAGTTPSSFRSYMNLCSIVYVIHNYS